MEQPAEGINALRRDITELRGDLGSMRDRITRTETRGEALSESMAQMRARFDVFDAKLDEMIAQISQGIGGAKIVSWMGPMMVAAAVALCGWLLGGHKL